MCSTRFDTRDALPACTLLEAVNGIIATRPASFKSILPRYYKFLATCCQENGPACGSLDFTLGIVVTPLVTREDSTSVSGLFRTPDPVPRLTLG